MQSYVSSGFYSVMNDLMESVSEYFQSNATRSYGEKIADANLAVTIAMSYIAVAASVVVNIFVSRKMRYRFLMLVVLAFCSCHCMCIWNRICFMLCNFLWVLS